MPFLSRLLVAASGVIIISGALSSDYDPSISSLDDLTSGTEGSQEADLFPEQNLVSDQAGLTFSEPDPGFGQEGFALDDGIDLSVTDLNADRGPSSTDWHTSWLNSGHEISCTGGDIQANEKTRHRTRDMCFQDSQEKKPTIPQIPNLLDFGLKNRFSKEGVLVPWDDTPCYPPYTNRLCCAGPATPLDRLTQLFANVMGCSACSFCVNTLYSFCIT